MDMINQICQMLSFCWKLLSAYFAENKISKSITKYSSNCKVCMYYEHQRLFFQCLHADQIVTCFQILSYKNGVTIP